MTLPNQDGVVLWLEAESIIAAASGTVTGWNDLSSSNNDLDIVEGDPNNNEEQTPTGLASVAFDGDEDSLQRVGGLNGLPSGNDDRTMFVVVKYDDSNDYAGAVYGDSSGNQAFGLITSTSGNLTVQGYGGANDFPSSTPAVGQGWLIHSAVYDSDVAGVDILRAYRDGISNPIREDTHTFNTQLNKIVLGEEAGGRDQVDANIAAVIVYDRALDDSERLGVESYLSEKYLTGAGDGTPSALNDGASVDIGGTVQINILANDRDDGAPVVPSDVTVGFTDQPDNGTITNYNANTGVVTYQHDGSVNNDSFAYTIEDGDGNVSAEATVSIDAGIAELPLDGFVDGLVVSAADSGSDITQPVSLAFFPDGRILIVQRTGNIQILNPETGETSEYMDLSNINSSGNERGLLDIALHPDFDPSQPGADYFYLFYTPSNPQNARIERFEHVEGSGGLSSTGNLGSGTVVWQDVDGYDSCCHYGGGLDFGPDGNLWLTSSDKFNTSTPSEGGPDEDLPIDPASTSGRVIRIRDDGTIPDGTRPGEVANPYIGDQSQTGPVNPAVPLEWDPNQDGQVTALDGTPVDIPDSVWAYGARNPFRAHWDLENELFYIGEVGGNQNSVAHENLHLASLDQAGAFMGWPFYENGNVNVNGGNSDYNPANFPQPDGDLADAANGDYYSAPIFTYPRGGGASMTGGIVYRGDLFPDEWDGVYFYGDYTRDEIRYLRLSEDGREVLGDYDFKPTTEIPGNTSNIVYLDEGNDGALYYIIYSRNGGEIRRVTFEGNQAPIIESASATPQDGAAPLEVLFEFTVSDPDDGPGNLSYTLNFGDGNSDVGTPDANGDISVTYTYQGDDQTYNAVLIVSDTDRQNSSSPIAIMVGDPNDAPEIESATANTGFGDIGDVIEFTASATDNDGDALTYTWDFGDGSPTQEGQNVTYAYSIDGNFVATVQVSDGTDTTTSDGIDIQIGDSTEVPVTEGLVFAIESFIKVAADLDGTVSGWLDTSGNGQNLSASGDPLLVQDQTPSGLPAVVLDGVGDYLDRVDGPGSTLLGFAEGDAARTMFFVVDYGPASAFGGLSYGTGAPDQAFGLVLNGSNNLLTVQGWGGGNDNPSTTNGADLGFISHSVVMADGGDYTHYLNGDELETGSNNFNTVVNRLVIGEEIAGGGNGEPMSVAAAFIYNRELSEEERGQVEEYIQQTYLTESTNTDPVAEDDSFTTSTNTALTGENLLADNGNGIDSDPDGDDISVTAGSFSTTQGGTVDINEDGTFTYTPAQDFTGTDTFGYTLNDETDGSDTATVTVTVGNQPPVDFPDIASIVVRLESDRVTTDGVDGNGAMIVDGWLDQGGLGFDLGKSADATNDPTLALSATPTGKDAVMFDGTGDFLERAGPANLGFLPDGAEARTMFFVVDYDPADAYAGVSYGDNAQNQTFGLTLDGSGGNLTVQGFGGDNDQVSDTDGVTPGFIVQSVVYQDTDGGTPDFVHYLNGQEIDSGEQTFNTDTSAGDAKFIIGKEIGTNGDGEPMKVAAVLVFNEALSETDRQAVESYLQTKYITGPVGGNQDPVAEDDSFTTDEDVQLTTGNLLADNGNGADSDPDGDPITVTAVTGLATTEGGSVDINEDGTFTYTPAAGFFGTDSFDYTLNDDTDGTDTGTVTITVNEDTGGGGDNPAGVDGLVFWLESDTGINETANVVDSWEDQSASGYDVAKGSNVNSDPTVGVVTTPTGQAAITFDGVEDFLDRAGDAQPNGFENLPGGAEARTVFFVVDYDAASAFAGFSYGDNELNETFGLTLNGGGGNLTVQGFGNANDQPSSTNGVTPGFIVQSVVYEVKPGVDDDFVHYLNGVEIDSGDHVFDTDVTTNPPDGLSRIVIGEEIASAGNGEPMSVAAVLVYDKALSETDRQAVESYLQTKYITGPVGGNQDPVAEDDSFTTDEDVALTTGNLLADNGNGVDSDPDGDPITVTAVTGLATTEGGSVDINEDGTFTYTPADDFNGTDTFGYTLNDDTDGTDTGTATITVNPVNDDPVAEDDSFTTDEDVPLTTGNLLADNGNGADSDPDGDPITVTAVTGLATTEGGSVDINEDGTFTYTPAAGFFGTDSFDYTLNDDTDGTDTGTVTITVNEDTGGGDNPAGVDGLVLWLESDTGIVGTGGNVDTWEDQSASGYDVSKGSDTDNQPTLEAGATLTGEDAIVFDGDEDFLELTGDAASLAELPDGSEARTIFFVVDYDQAERFAGVSYGNNSTNETFGLTLNGPGSNLTVQGFSAADQPSSTNGVLDGNGVQRGFIVQSVVYEVKPGVDDDFVHYLNGVEIDSGDQEFNTVLERLVIGEEINSLGDGEPMKVAAVLVYNKALDEIERGAVETYLQDKYIGDPPPNQAPVALDDAFTATKDTQLTGENVLADNGNGPDFDPDSDPIVVTAGTFATAEGGSVTINQDGTFTYNPLAGFVGEDSFDYTLDDDDDDSGSDTGTVTIDVVEVAGQLILGSNGVADDLVGGAGNDTLKGFGGIDSHDGGAGNDTVDISHSSAPATVDLPGGLITFPNATETLKSIESVVGTQGNNRIIGTDGNNTVDGQGGVDTMVYSGPSSAYTVTENNGVTTVQGPNGEVDTLISVEFLEFLGDADGELILGSNGVADVLVGGAGNDTLKGFGGIDSHDGGEGNDTVDISHSSAPATVDLPGGLITFPNATETIESIESVVGTQGNNRIIGTDGNNTVDGQGGDDTMVYSGSETDYTITDNNGVTTVEGPNGEVDTLINVEFLEFQSDATGELILGSNGVADNLVGGAGNDTLKGFSGLDFHDGQGGNDTVDVSHTGLGAVIDLAGGTIEFSNGVVEQALNIESVIGTQGNNRIIGTDDNNTVDGQGGVDTMVYSGSETDYTITVENGTTTVSNNNTDEVDTLTNVEFLEFLDDATGELILGSNGVADILVGGSGDDTLKGFGGIDQHFGNGGNDTADISHSSASATIDFDAGLISFPNADEIIDSIESVIATQGNNRIFSNAQDNTIDGQNGTDTVVYALASTFYTVTDNGDSFTVNGPGGEQDTLINIEQLNFADTNDLPIGDFILP